MKVRGRGVSQLSCGGKIIGRNGRTFALYNVTAGREGGTSPVGVDLPLQV